MRHVTRRGLVKPGNELAEGLRVVRLEGGKGIVNLRVLVWWGEPPDKLGYGKIGGKDTKLRGWYLASCPGFSLRCERVWGLVILNQGPCQ